ncbi:MAG: DegT/DnrJ/EryC1/StrS family aminotransferase [Oscillospiraceae bacterium]|nr:DegT/DnrJ/EryC1/StrS family aminotransferase [Oscillospiraceae bacterium]
MNDLLALLKRYAAAPRAPFHMPGHKRNAALLGNDLPYDIDITEIEGFDNLHAPEGVLKQGMERAAALWGSERCYFSVNGSSGAVLAGIRALTKRGDTILMARNCHISVFHAVELCGLRPVYLEPEWDDSFGLYGAIAPEALRRAARAHPGAACCVITSPTYEGIASDIGALAAVLHERDIPLLADAAHGAHLEIGKGFGGADITIHSLHKTLPALTQCAALHVNGARVDIARLEHQLALFQTSSPSYVLLASIDRCVSVLAEQKEELFSLWDKRLDAFYQAALGWERLRLLQNSDRAKLVLDVRGTGLDAAAFAARLRRDYAIEPEYALGHIVLLMTSCCDSDESMRSLTEALRALDQRAGGGKRAKELPAPRALPAMNAQERTIAEALEAPAGPCHYSNTIGCLSGEYLWAYPPGIPLLAPGQRITAACAEAARAIAQSGGRVHTTRKDWPRIWVLK